MPNRTRVAALAVLAMMTPAAAGCRGCSSPSSNEGTSRGASSSEEQPAGESSGAASGAARPAHGGDPRAEAIRLDASSSASASAACTGASIAFERAVLDPGCATTVSGSKALRAALEVEGGKAPKLRQEARAEAGGRVAVALLHDSAEPVAIPLSWHPRVAAFTVLAEDARGVVYELEAPKLDVVGPDGGASGAHFAKIVVPPGGRAFATIAIDPKIVRRLDRSCDDAGVDCLPARLPRGHYTLHVGQLVCDVEAGPPAKLPWDAD